MVKYRKVQESTGEVSWTMKPEEYFKIADEAILAKEGQHLRDPEKFIIEGSVEGNTYEQIAKKHGYAESTFKQDYGQKLWDRLSKALGEKVTKKSFRAALERYGPPQRDIPPPQTTDPQSESGQSEEAQLAAGLDDGLTRWVGRETLIGELIAKLLGNCRVLSLVGITGIGKTSLAAQLTRQPQIKAFLPQLFVVDFYQESPDFQVVARRVLGENLASQLLPDDDALLRAIVQKLQSQPCLLVLDMLEAVLQADTQRGHGFEQPVFGEFLDAVVSVPEMRSRLILTSQDRPPVGAEGRFGERYYTEPMKGLEPLEARMLFTAWEVQINSDGDGEYLDRMIAVYEGHPLALRVIAGDILSQPYLGDIQAFWHDYGYEIEEVERLKVATEGDPRDDRPNLTFSILKDLVRKRIESSVARLRKDNSLAYKLFCMGGTNRQAVPRSQWLFLIGDCPRDEQSNAFAALQRRFLLEEERINRNVYYRLHNLIREVALEGLRELEQEECSG